MKISPLQLNGTDGTTPAGQGHPVGGSRNAFLEESELSFLDFFTVMSKPVQDGLKALKAEDAKPAPDEKSNKAEHKQKAAENAKQALPSHTTSLNETVSRLQINRELDLLKADLKTQLNAQDLQGFQAILAGIPYQGAVPVQQAFLMGEDGKLFAPRNQLSDDMITSLQNAYKTNRPLRVDLDNKSAVILKFSHGKVSAEFLTSEPAMALQLKQQLDELKARMEAKNLPVGTLSYRDEQKNRKQKQSDEE